jgi:hypothetical protein
MNFLFLKNLASRYYIYMLCILTPKSAYAYGQEAALIPLFFIALILLIPLVNLILRGAWNYSALYVLAIPFIWFFAWVIGMGLTMLGGVFATFGLVLGVGIASIMPFVFWRRILKWIDAKT